MHSLEALTSVKLAQRLLPEGRQDAQRRGPVLEPAAAAYARASSVHAAWRPVGASSPSSPSISLEGIAAMVTARLAPGARRR